MTANARATGLRTNPVQPAKPEKPKRSPEETAALKRELMLGINSYHIGSYKDAVLYKLHNHIFQGDWD